MYDPFRTLWGIVAVAGAALVGVYTRDAGFTALTFLGGLVLPRVLGFRRHRTSVRWAGTAMAALAATAAHASRPSPTTPRQPRPVARSANTMGSP